MATELRAARGLLGLLALLIGCSAPAPVGRGATSSSILHDAERRLLWLTSPDDDEVVAVDLLTLAVLERIEVRGGPEHLVMLEGGLGVSLSRSAEIAWVRLDPTEVEYRDVPCGGTSGIAADGEGVFFACPSDDRVVELAPFGGLQSILPSTGRPSRLGITEGHLVVTGSKRGEIQTHRLEGLREVEVPGTPWKLDTASQGRSLEGRDGFAATQLEALAVDPASGELAIAYQVVDHDSDRLRPPEQGGYGSVFDDAPRIEPRVLARCGGRYARFDGGVRASSGPSAIGLAGGRLWIAHRQTDTVSVHPCEDGFSASDLVSPVQDELPTLGVFSVGRGPRGIALSEDGRTAWVDVGFDHAVARLELAAPPAEPLAAYLEAAAVQRRPITNSVLSEAAERGRKLFFDAVDTHLTPSGVVTCGTCHPAGGEDGLSWFLHTRGVARKLRRTPPAWAAQPEMAPFHWDGEFTSAAELTATTIRELMEGDGLLIDTDAIAAYMASVPPPPPRPVPERLRDAHADGEALFESTGCAECHPAPTFQDGRRHAVFGPSPDRDGRLDEVDTPSLLGIRTRAPYLHDGRAQTMRELLLTYNPDDTHGATSNLDDAALGALEVYLESL